MIEQHYKTNELADRLGMSPDTIRRAVDRGELTYRRIGSDWYFAESVVEKWLAAHNVEPAKAKVLQLKRETGRSTPSRRSA